MPHMMHLGELLDQVGPRWSQGGNMKQKMSFKKIVLSKEGVKREQRGSKKGAKRCWGWSMLQSGGGKGGPMLR